MFTRGKTEDNKETYHDMVNIVNRLMTLIQKTEKLREIKPSILFLFLRVVSNYTLACLAYFSKDSSCLSKQAATFSLIILD